MQIVYLSARPEIFAETLRVSEKFMPFLSNALVVVPESMVDKFKPVQSRIDPVFLTDEEVTGCSRAELDQLDHTALNYRLRSDLVFRPEIESDFIMSDDDYRPLCEIPITTFKNNNRYRAYYFYDLPMWKFGNNPFDSGQRNALAALQTLELPVLAYAAHMPQIVNKMYFQESVKAIGTATGKLAMCEWATYFNYAIHHHPESFHTPEPYKTLVWPDCVSCWPRMFYPSEFLFENYYPKNYIKDGAFFGLRSMPVENPSSNKNKILAWQSYENSVLDGNRFETERPYRNLLLRLLKLLRIPTRYSTLREVTKNYLEHGERVQQQL